MMHMMNKITMNQMRHRKRGHKRVGRIGGSEVLRSSTSAYTYKYYILKIARLKDGRPQPSVA